jgi:hypothetical protein
MNVSAVGLVRVLKAGLVLAGVYTLAVVGLLAIVAVLGAWDLFIEDVVSLTAPFAILFGFAFLVLVIARRIGFLLLWLVLVGLWVWMLLVPGVGDPFLLLTYGVGHPFRFVGWSVLAFPLFIISVVAGAQPSLTKVGPWHASTAFVMAVLWMVLAAAGVVLRDYGHPHYSWGSESAAIAFAILGWLVWGVMPFLIAGLAVRAFWTGTESVKLVDAAA